MQAQPELERWWSIRWPCPAGAAEWLQEEDPRTGTSQVQDVTFALFSRSAWGELAAARRFADPTSAHGFLVELRARWHDFYTVPIPATPYGRLSVEEVTPERLLLEELAVVRW